MKTSGVVLEKDWFYMRLHKLPNFFVFGGGRVVVFVESSFVKKDML